MTPSAVPVHRQGRPRSGRSWSSPERTARSANALHGVGTGCVKGSGALALRRGTGLLAASCTMHNAGSGQVLQVPQEQPQRPRPCLGVQCQHDLAQPHAVAAMARRVCACLSGCLGANQPRAGLQGGADLQGQGWPPCGACRSRWGMACAAAHVRPKMTWAAGPALAGQLQRAAQGVEPWHTRSARPPALPGAGW